jgi:hypothetical protein
LTGQRPSFDPGVTAAPGTTAPARATGVSDEILALFDSSTVEPFTAVYRVRQTAQQVTATAILTRDATRTALDIRDVQFRESGGQRQTCNRSSNFCQPGYAEQRLSDLQITSGFWGPSVKDALRSPALNARIGPITTVKDTLAGQGVTCVNIPGPGRVDRYCALDNGVLASMDNAAVSVTLMEYRSTFDQQVWDEFKPTS